jgi:toxin YoeB
MKITFSEDSFEQFTDWQQRDKKVFKRIKELLADIQRNGHVGMGRPEQLRHQYTGWWSRRIDREHRLIYQIDEQADAIIVLSCQYHY